MKYEIQVTEIEGFKFNEEAETFNGLLYLISKWIRDSDATKKLVIKVKD
jgi:hypothetical protein